VKPLISPGKFLLIAGVLLLLVGAGGCAGNRDGDWIIAEKLEDEKIVLYSMRADSDSNSRRFKLQLPDEAFQNVRIGDRLTFDGDKVTLTHPEIETPKAEAAE
jgi:hypothetical protein